ncbi:hypothetical protein VCSRO207_3269 [Vibrio cholerae]|nr:hypothetical protein VCSRO207_3269 [Vibrio cholerae]
MNNRLVEETIAEETIDCCPLCQHDEFFISADKEKFYCAKCGFHTNTLTSIQPMLAAKANLTQLCPHRDQNSSIMEARSLSKPHYFSVKRWKMRS